MSKEPRAVLISDVHYNIKTLEVADKAMRMAVDKSNELQVPLVVCGDLHDTKANLRGECIQAMLETLKLSDVRNRWNDEEKTLPFVLVGNHDKINEKSENNSLSFLDAYVNLIDKTQFINEIACKSNSLLFIPYQHDSEEFKRHLKRVENGAVVIVHQGIQGSNAGEYFHDKSAITPEDVSGLRVISGHYHNRQTIDLPNGGKWDYVGNPFSLNFGEANDPPKGFQILYDDGSLEFVPTNLRKHVIIELDQLPYGQFARGLDYKNVKENDLVWVKVYGTKEDLQKLVKENIATNLEVKDFKLELIPDEVKTEVQHNSPTSQPELLDSLIESLSNTTPAQKQRLKAIWKDIVG